MSLVSSDLNQAITDKTTMIPAKPDKSNLKVAELKNGKVIFRQKPISFDNHSETMQEIVTFRGFLESSHAPLATIPDEHLPLVAKLVHESDKTLNTLIKSLQSSLVPPVLESSQESESGDALNSLPASTVEHAIKAVADRANYGITTDTDKPPAALCIWRWEVKNADWLPKSVAEKAAVRLKERVAAKKQLQAIFDDLSADDKEAILKTAKQNRAAKGKEIGSEPGVGEKQVSQSPTPDQKGEDSESSAKKPSRPKKPVDPETIAREKERLEKKAVKAEKEKKAAEATKRSAAVFANFFRPAAQSSKSSKGHDPVNVPTPSSSSSVASTDVNAFQATFKPFVLKKDSQLAPVNWFVADKRNKGLQSHLGHKGEDKQNAVIELDVEGREVQTTEDQCIDITLDAGEDDVSGLSPKDLLRLFLDSTPTSSCQVPRGPYIRTPWKSGPVYRVREIVNQLTEAEVQGDQRAVRRLTGLLKSRRKVPAKVFVFAENNRPGYLGTWTRSSSTIRPRRPFTRDLLSFDYDHDSDVEWEKEEDGEDVDSPDESMADDASSVGSDLDDWLVEGDEIEVEGTDSLQGSSLPGWNINKRKAAESRELPNKKRRVVPLVPFQKGPIWEKEIGQCEYEPFRTMRIQLFNDTPFSVDPFTFVSEPVVLDKLNSSATKAGTVFVVPALPSHLHPPAGEPSTEDARGAKRKAAIPQPPPKTTFPDVHVPLLLQKVSESNTSSFVVLLDLVFQEIKSLGVKKNALEVKLREVAEKDKTKKSWVVKEDAWTKHGLINPTQ